MWKITLQLTALLIALGTATLQAQSLRPIDLVNTAKNQGSFEMELQPLTRFNGRASVPELDRQQAEYTVMDIDQAVINNLFASAPDRLLLDLPGQGRSSNRLELVRVNIFADNFGVIESGTNAYAKVNRGLHYRGIANGDERTTVALSFSGDEVMGLIATPTGNRVIGRLGNAAGGRHVLYNDEDIEAPDLGACMVQDDGGSYTREELDDVHFGGRDASNCVNVYLEIDNTIFNKRGSSAKVTSFMTGLFNQVATLYANEQINIKLSDMFIWTTADPYSGANAGTTLTEFRQNRTSFNGNLAAYVTYEASGGVAFVDVLCSPTFAYSVSGIQNSYATVPTYSWSVNVLAHELGHNFGSRHTQACAWNGNATAIDGCYSSEGNCSNGPIPIAGGGTIMSYCHLKQGVGIDLANGFGPQPGAVIRNSAYNDACLTSCGTSPPSSGGGDDKDGGNECIDLSIVIKTDNYPGETSWEIRNAAGVTLISANGYGGKNTTYTTNTCLPEGCYTFVINDQYGDGICCSYGNGDYSIKVGSQTLINGGAFARSESKDFCLEDDDGGDDGGGDDDVCDALDFTTNAPVSYGGSQDRGQVVVQADGSMIIRNNAWKSIALDYTVTRNTILEFDFGSITRGEIHGIGFDNNNSISSNRTFQLFGTQRWGIQTFNDYAGSEGQWKTYRIPVGQSYTGTFNRLTFASDHDSGARNGDSFFRNLRIYEGSECVAFLPATDALNEDSEESVNFVSEALTVYPNPASHEITAAFSLPAGGNAEVEVFNLQGKLLYQDAYRMAAGARQFQVPVSGVPVGTYLLRLTTETGYQASAKFNVLR